MGGLLVIRSRLIFALLAVSACFSPHQKISIGPVSQSQYSITVSRDDIRNVLVTADLPLSNDTLRMSQSEFAPLPDGYATFVHGLEATDDHGNAVDLTALGKGKWTARLPVPATIHIRYTVEIGHDHVPWSVSGAFAKAYSIDSVLFFAGRPLFIASAGNDSSPIKIHFNIPPGWLVISPYADAGSEQAEQAEQVEQAEQNDFIAKNLSSLWGNGNMIGRCVKQEIGVGQLRVILAGSYPMKEALSLFKDALSKIVDVYTTEMGGAPGGKLVIMAAVAPLVSGGETFSNSISLLFTQSPGLYDKASWGYLIAHEVFHLWNGHAIAPADQPQVEWFVEGFTDYMSKLAALRTGFITQSEWLQQIVYSYQAYRSNAGRLSMIAAGVNKGANYDLIYGGGLTAAMALDIICRKATQNKTGIAGIMKKMYTGFGLTGKPYTYTDIIKVCNATAGTDLTPFFETYIAGTQFIPLDQYCSSAGLDLTNQNGQIDLQPKKNMSPTQSALFQSILAK